MRAYLPNELNCEWEIIPQLRVAMLVLDDRNYIDVAYIYHEDDDMYEIYQPEDLIEPNDFVDYMNDMDNSCKGTSDYGYKTLGEAIRAMN